MSEIFEKASPKKQKIYTLHRYFVWANKMRTDFDNILSAKKQDKYSKIESMMYMSLWYGLLYVVIEGWNKLKLSDNEIDLLLRSKNVKLLKNYRHGVFHYHENYNDQKFINFFLEQTTVNWVRSLNKEFGRWFLETLSNNNKFNN